MDTVTLVENQIDDGQRLLDQLVNKGVAVRAACWVKAVDEDRWSLSIITPAIDEKGPAAAYREVLSVLRSLGKVWITTSDITLIGEQHPFARDVLGLQERFPDATWLRQPQLDGMGADELYLYSLGKVPVTIYGLVYRGEPSKGLHLSFEPYDSHTWLEVESNGTRIEYPGETGRDWVVAAPQGAVLERDSDGQKVLNWNLRGKQMHSSANEVWSLANLELHGFRFLREPA
jgi:hypothetical protein